MVSLLNHDDESMAYGTLRQAQGDTSGLFATSSNFGEAIPQTDEAKPGP
jgi:hypothetical protein